MSLVVIIGSVWGVDAAVKPPSHVMKMGNCVECKISTTCWCVGLVISDGDLSVGIVNFWRKAVMCVRRSVVVWMMSGIGIRVVVVGVMRGVAR
jgi:hypothetical protein